MAAFAQGNKPGKGYIYGSGKLVARTMTMSVAADLGIDLLWAEITNAYGAGEVSPRFINSTIRKILKNEPLLLYHIASCSFIHCIVRCRPSAKEISARKPVSCSVKEQSNVSNGRLIPVKGTSPKMNFRSGASVACISNINSFKGLAQELPISI